MAQGRSEKAAAWLRANPEWVRDPACLEQLDGAHKLAKAQHAEGSDAYFAAVESLLGISKGSSKRSDNGSGRRAVAPVAPVSHSPGGTGGGPQTVRLTPAQVRTAEDGTINWTRADLVSGRLKDASKVGTPVGRVEYARRLSIMQRDPKWNMD